MIKRYQDKQLLEDIYDLTKVCGLNETQNNQYAILCREFANDAKKGLHNFIRGKSIEWDGNKNIIKIGKHITIHITYE